MISPFRKRFIWTIRKSFKPQSYAKMTRGFVETIGFSVPCASDVREGFTPGTALRKSFKPQSSARMTRGFVGATGFFVLFEKAS
jgi:hypothetical protein